MKTSLLIPAALALASAYALAQGSIAPQPLSPFTSPQAGAAGQAVSMHLHPVGETGGCQTAVRVLNMHYPSMACAQSAADFNAKWLANFHLKSKCPIGQPMKGVYGIDCVNAPISGFSSGSVFSATVCCGVPHHPSPVAQATASTHGEHGHDTHDLHEGNHHPRFMRLHDVPLRMETTAKGEACPEPGARFTRQMLAAPGFLWRNHDRVLDNLCRGRGAPRGFYSVKFNSCWHQPNPQAPRQTQYFVNANVVCER